jgi:ABC-type nitrate/sulfonate/bicarbonate transport system substrate-binding protein
MEKRQTLGNEQDETRSERLTRRQAIALGGRAMGMVAVGGATSALAHNRLLGTSLRSAMAAPKYGTINLQLNWLINVQYGGSFLANSKGYYSKAGVAVDLRPGGPNVSVEPLVVSGKADIGIDDIEAVSGARKAGADLVAIAAGWQENPECMISLASNPIKTPRGLIGKRLGIPADSVVTVGNWLKGQGIEPNQYTTVPVQSDPTPLADHEVDAYYGIVTSEPITLEVMGVKTYCMMCADFGLPELTELYFVQGASLKDSAKRAAITAFMEGEIRGWQDFVANPIPAVNLAVNVYGKALHLNHEEQLLEAKAFVSIIKSPWTNRHGLLTMGPTQITQSLKTLKLEKLPATAAMFDSSLIDAIFAGKSRLS